MCQGVHAWDIPLNICQPLVVLEEVKTSPCRIHPVGKIKVSIKSDPCSSARYECHFLNNNYQVKCCLKEKLSFTHLVQQWGQVHYYQVGGRDREIQKGVTKTDSEKWLDKAVSVTQPLILKECWFGEKRDSTLVGFRLEWGSVCQYIIKNWMLWVENCTVLGYILNWVNQMWTDHNHSSHNCVFPLWWNESRLGEGVTNSRQLVGGGE